jgi:hypothetical protein
VHGERRHQRESGALHELLIAACPLPSLLPRERRPVKEVRAEKIAEVPRIDRGDPTLRLSVGDAVRLLDEDSEDARLVDP